MKPTVLVAGATGYIGSAIAVELGKAGIQTSALVRPNTDKSDKRLATLKTLEEAGVAIIEGSLEDEDALVEIMKKFNTVISALSGNDIVSGQLKLIAASKKAGTINRFFPSEFGADWPQTGAKEYFCNPTLSKFLQGKEIVFEALQSSGLGWTSIVNYSFMGYILPQLGQLGPPPVPDTVTLYAGGNMKGATILEADIGKVVVRSLTDPRTMNRKLVIKANTDTQREIVDTWERISGKKVNRKEVSAEEYSRLDKENSGMAAFFSGLTKSIWIDGVCEKSVEGAVLATDLYPDLHFTTIEEFLQRFV